MDELLEQWRDPVFNDPHGNVPAVLAARLTEMADEITAGENIAEAIANARIRDAPDDLLVTPLRHGALPKSPRSYYEQMHALLAVAGLAKITDPATFQLDSPPSDTEQQFGGLLGHAFHQGCRLADVALAAGPSPDQVVAIGKRTIRRTGWLKHL